MAKVLVTGGAGFIGSHISDQLKAQGHEVHVLDDLSGGKRENVSEGITLHTNDMRTKEARELISSLAPEIVVHAAAQASVRISMEEPWLDTDLNVTGLVNVLAPFRGRSGVHVVFLSSGGACYGEQDVFPASESHPIRPASVYGLSKRVGEMYLEFWAREWGVTSTSLRLSNVYGPRQNPHGEAGVVAIFCERLLQGQSISVNGSGEQTRDFVYVGDVARAVVQAAQSRVVGEFNIGTSRETSINEIARRLRDMAAPNVEIGHAPAKAGEQMRSCIDNARAKQKLAWSPEVDLDQGLSSTLEWYKTIRR
jgi:UDP-glucose 4-epimerase